MATCKSCKEKFWAQELNSAGLCRNCRARKQAADLEAMAEAERRRIAAAGILLTTETVAPFDAERLGIVAAEAAFGISLLKDFFIAVRDVVGGRSTALQGALREARQAALDGLREEAYALGADAVVAVDIDLSEFSGAGAGGTMVMVAATGTAVRRKGPQQ